MNARIKPKKPLHEIKADRHRKAVAKAENTRALHEIKTGQVETFDSVEKFLADLQLDI